ILAVGPGGVARKEAAPLAKTTAIVASATADPRPRRLRLTWSLGCDGTPARRCGKETLACVTAGEAGHELREPVSRAEIGDEKAELVRNRELSSVGRPDREAADGVVTAAGDRRGQGRGVPCRRNHLYAAAATRESTTIAATAEARSASMRSLRIIVLSFRQPTHFVNRLARGRHRLRAVGVVVVREFAPYRRAEGEFFRAVGVLVARVTGPRRRPEGAFRKEILERARATELGPRLAKAQASRRGLGCCLGSAGRRFCPCDEDQPEVVVGQLIGVRHEEVRSDPPTSAVELALAALALPDGGAVAEVGVGRAAESSRADAAEGEYVARGELDRPGLVEGAVIRQGEARDEQRFLALAGLDMPCEPVGIDGRDQHLARRGCAVLEHS